MSTHIGLAQVLPPKDDVRVVIAERNGEAEGVGVDGAVGHVVDGRVDSWFGFGWSPFCSVSLSWFAYLRSTGRCSLKRNAQKSFRQQQQQQQQNRGRPPRGDRS